LEFGGFELFVIVPRREMLFKILITYVDEPLLTVTAKTWDMDKVEVGESLECEACYQFS
jgi:hypothetical protein